MPRSTIATTLVITLNHTLLLLFMRIKMVKILCQIFNCLIELNLWKRKFKSLSSIGNHACEPTMQVSILHTTLNKNKFKKKFVCFIERTEVCKKLLKHRTKQPQGCNLGNKSEMFHAEMCSSSISKQECYQKHCKLTQIKKTQPKIRDNIEITAIKKHWSG